MKDVVLVACLSIRTAAQAYLRNFNLPNYKQEVYAKVCYSSADTAVTLTKQMTLPRCALHALCLSCPLGRLFAVFYTQPPTLWVLDALPSGYQYLRQPVHLHLPGTEVKTYAFTPSYIVMVRCLIRYA